MNAFSTNIVTKPEEFFGRQDFINNIIDNIHGMNNCAIIGARRFGKTNVLQQMKRQLENDETIFPILIDSRDVGNSNGDTADVYRCLIAMMAEELYNADIFKEKESFYFNCEITPWEEWGAVYQQVCQYEGKNVISLFESIVKSFAKRMNKTILLMIDEYEYLLTKSMEPEGFNTIRGLTQKPIKNTSLMPMKYLICGAKNWEIFQKEIDSGVLNQTGVTEYLPPISEKDFKDMWRYETSRKDVNQTSKAKLMQNMDLAYILSGGVPFYGKIIGNYICRQGSCPDYSEFRPFFNELVNNQFNSIQLSILLDLINNEQPEKVTNNLFELRKEGIISQKNTDDYHICIKLLEDYIKANYDELSSRIRNKEIHEDEYTKLVDEIFVTIKKINFTRKSKGLDLIFHPSDSDDTQTCMKSKCTTDNDLATFFRHVYITYAERTSNYKDGQRIDGTYGRSLPGDYKTENKFFNAIGTMRHMNIHSDYNKRNNQMSIPEALDFFDVDKMPVNSSGYATLQLNVLKKMYRVMKEMLEFVQNE